MAADKVALVIGNSNYDHVGLLPNPKNDADDVAAALEGVGFSVRKATDVTFDQMRQALGAFSHDAAQADMAVVFFAGHGIEVDKHNFLLPTDAKLESDLDVNFQTVPLDMVVDAVSRAHSLRLVFLDACRNNPFANRMRLSDATRSIGRGLSPIEPKGSTIVFYSARDGTVASDGSGRNSPYSQALLKYLPQADLDVDKMLRKIRDDVLKATNNVQEPTTYGLLPSEDIFLVQSRSAVSLVEKPKGDDPPVTVPAAIPVDPAATEWAAIENLESPAILRTFIQAHGDTVYGKYAEARLAELQERERQRQQTGEQQSSQPPPASQASLQSPQYNIPSTTPAPPRHWYLATYSNVDFYGGDLYSKGLESASLDQCAQTCAANLSCKLFTYNSAKNRCFPKSEFSYAQIMSGAQAGYFFESERRDQAPTFRAEWEIFVKADLLGGDNYSARASSYDDCLLMCKSDQSCRAFSYVPFGKSKSCWIKTFAATLPTYSQKTERGIVSGRRADMVVRADGVYDTAARY
ncbi:MULTISPECIES: caspase family protein [unclassified Mesorhizobium]|uniref:caspase family protein n=1 Tax=unclassified Mesorhizobium TaxID=325217 RepID=UPI0015E3EF62|nr:MULTISPECIES: caspase family protein [unclassified Mesorhizobium]MCA0034078.1 caspase family protein [Mesorhizobium sp. B263B2A]